MGTRLARHKRGRPKPESYLPITVLEQHIFDVPNPDPVPALVLWDGLYKGAPSYWISWVVGLLICLAPGMGFVAFRRSRRFGAGYVITAAVLCVLIAAAVASYDIGGGISPG